MKKLYILAVGLLGLASSAWAQTPQQHLRIQVSFEGNGRHLERAIETIEAVNVVHTASTVDYQAGQSVTLLPGFEAKTGSLFSASIKPISVKEGDIALKLSASPNPFEQSTTIQYYLPADGKVNVWVIDAQGKVVEHLVNEETQPAGVHKMEWKPAAAGSGVYIPMVEANGQRANTRVVKK